MSDHGQAKKKHADPDRNGRDKYERHVAGDITIHGRIETQVSPEEEKKETAREAKEDSRDGKRFVVECLTLFFIIVYAALAAWQGCEAHKSADISYHALYDQQHPFVGLDMDQGGVRISNITIDGKRSAWINYEVSVKNFGNYPAEGVTSLAQLVLIGPTPMGDTPDLAQARVCMSYIADDVGDVVFPNSSHPASSYTGSSWDIPKTVPETDTLQPFVVGCVIYKDQFGATYRTGFTYMLYDPKIPFGHVVTFPAQPNTQIGGQWILRNATIYRLPDYLKSVLYPPKKR